MKPRSQKPQSFLIVSPEFQNHHGGVQTYSRLMYQSVQSLYPDSVVRLIDYNADSFSRFPSLNILTKIRVALRILFQCWLTHPICLVTHVDLAPVTHIAKKLFGTTYLLSCHGIEVWSPLSAAKTRALEQADQLLAVSRFTARRIGDSSPTVKANISIFPNTFELTSPAHSRDAAKQWLSDRYGLAPSPLVLFTLSRLRPADREKGYFSALRAAAIIRERGIDCCLIIGGSGPDEETLRTEARQLGFEKHLVMAGYIPDSLLPLHYAGSDLFLLPSKKEGFGISLLESLSQGTPALAGNRDGAMDPLVDGQLGLLANPDSPDEIAETIIGWWNQPEHPFHDPEYLKNEITNRFGLQAYQNRLKEILDRYCDEAPPVE